MISKVIYFFSSFPECGAMSEVEIVEGRSSAQICLREVLELLVLTGSY